MLDDDGDGYGDAYAPVPFDGGTDCNDTDATIVAIDGDNDGYSQCVDDCNDSVSSINPSETEVYYDGVDQNCDGLSDYDSDQDGSNSSDYGGTDCDDNDIWLNNLDIDSDGYSSCQDDCDDFDSSIAPFAVPEAVNGECMLDDDGDGYGDMFANGYDPGTDCDDANPLTYPGAAPFDSPSACLADADDDGYAPIVDLCYQLELSDSYGDGWNGGYLTIIENGVSIESGLPENYYSVYYQPENSFYHDGSIGNQSFEICFQEGATIEMNYATGTYEEENGIAFTSYSGELLTSISESPDTGLIFYRVLIGTDTDDTDGSLQ
jgi:hypothetical protein